jgi:hypothetical protein
LIEGRTKLACPIGPVGNFASWRQQLLKWRKKRLALAFCENLVVLAAGSRSDHNSHIARERQRRSAWD